MRNAVLAATLFLSACGQPAAPASPSNEPAATASSAFTTDAAPAITPAMLVGRWGDNGDCAKDIIINGDGTFASYTGGSGRWTLEGDVMSMTGAEGTFPVRVSIINGNTLMIGNPDGSFGMSQRC